MKIGQIKARYKSIDEQIASMKSKYPQFNITYPTHSSMKVVGFLQPTSRSVLYNFELKYNLTGNPRTKIISPVLQRNSKGEDIPHIYPGEYLCLYQPKYCEFTRADFLSDTIIPWTSMWLYHYEVWLMTDEWLGGGEHPITKPKRK